MVYTYIIEILSFIKSYKIIILTALPTILILIYLIKEIFSFDILYQYKIYGIPVCVFIVSVFYFSIIAKFDIRHSIYESILPVTIASALAFMIGSFIEDYTIIRFGKLKWDLNDFCRGWSITGRTGSGKTASAIMRILHQLFKNYINWGGLAVDEKGNFHEILTGISSHYKLKNKLINLQVRPEFAPKEWSPKYKFNLLSYPGIPWSTYAKIIVDTASSLGQENDKAFFKTQAQIHIAKAMEFLEVLNKPVTISNISKLLKSKESFIEMTNGMTDEQAVHESAIHFADNFLNQPEEQQGAVISTIYNYLHFFNEPDLQEVFSPNESNVQFEDIDKGKIFCVSLPQKYQTERKYINTFMKFLYYTHALRRFDLPSSERKKKNLLVFFADEAQGVVTSSAGAMEDSRVIDKIREAKATVVFAAQSITSYTGALKKENVNILLLNLSNQIYYTLADYEAAKIAANTLGKKEITKKNYTHNQLKTSTHTQKIEEFYFKESHLMKLKKFHCIIRHCEGKFIKKKLTPVNTENKRPKYYKWYMRLFN